MNNETVLLREADEYIEQLRQRKGLSALTLEAYRADLKRLSAFCSERKICSAAGIDEACLKQLIEQMKEDGASVSSVKRMISVLRGFFSCLQEEGQIDTDWSEVLGDCISDMQAKAAKKNQVNISDGPLSDLQLRALLAVPEQNDVSGLRDIAMIRILAETGIRTGELLELRVNDFDFLMNEISVRGADGTRHIPVTEQTSQALRDYIDANRYHLQSRSSLLFLNRTGEPISRQAVWKRISRCGARAGIAGDVNAERLRKTAAANMARAGIPLQRIQKLMGHAEPAVTRRMIRQW